MLALNVSFPVFLFFNFEKLKNFEMCIGEMNDCLETWSVGLWGTF